MTPTQEILLNSQSRPPLDAQRTFPQSEAVLPTNEQCRAARAILGLTVLQAAKGAKVAHRSILRSESGEGQENPNMRVRVLEKIQRFYESCGIEFVPAGPGYGPGVRRRTQ
jgi:hypothetical protein